MSNSLLDPGTAVRKAPHSWSWYVSRGLGVFFIGFGLAWAGYWAHALWLQVTAFVLAVVGMLMIRTGHDDWYDLRRGRFWRWYRAAYDRNVRAEEERAAGEDQRPPRPNDR